MDPTIQELFGWASSGSGRLLAAAILFALIVVVKRLPLVGDWLAVDGPFSWLTARRKKLAANVLLAMAPAAALLASDAPLSEVAVTAVEVVLIAAGLQGSQKAARAGGDQ